MSLKEKFILNFNSELEKRAEEQKLKLAVENPELIDFDVSCENITFFQGYQISGLNGYETLTLHMKRSGCIVLVDVIRLIEEDYDQCIEGEFYLKDKYWVNFPSEYDSASIGWTKGSEFEQNVIEYLEKLEMGELFDDKERIKMIKDEEENRLRSEVLEEHRSGFGELKSITRVTENTVLLFFEGGFVLPVPRDSLSKKIKQLKG